MKGLELSRKYYFAYGKGMLEEKFPMLAGRVAAGLAGQGSECLGFDDGISRDHDYGPSFCLWLTREDYEKYGNAMREEYRKLPQDFKGQDGKSSWKRKSWSALHSRFLLWHIGNGRYSKK